MNFEILTIHPLFTFGVPIIWYYTINSLIILIKEKPVDMIKRSITIIPMILITIIWFSMADEFIPKVAEFIRYTSLALIPIMYALPFQDLMIKTLDRGLKNFALLKEEK